MSLSFFLRQAAIWRARSLLAIDTSNQLISARRALHTSLSPSSADITLKRGLRILGLVPPVWVPFDEWASAVYHLFPKALTAAPPASAMELDRTAGSSVAVKESIGQFRVKLAAAVVRLAQYPQSVGCKLVTVSAPNTASENELAIPTFVRSNVSPMRKVRSSRFGVVAAESINQVVPLIVLHCHFPRSLAVEVRHHWAMHAASANPPPPPTLPRSSSIDATPVDSTMAAAEVLTILPEVLHEELLWKSCPSPSGGGGENKADAIVQVMQQLFRSFPEFFEPAVSSGGTEAASSLWRLYDPQKHLRPISHSAMATKQVENNEQQLQQLLLKHDEAVRRFTPAMKSALHSAVVACLLRLTAERSSNSRGSIAGDAGNGSHNPSLQSWRAQGRGGGASSIQLHELFRSVVALAIDGQQEVDDGISGNPSALAAAVGCLLDSSCASVGGSLDGETFLSCILEMPDAVVLSTRIGIVVFPAGAAALSSRIVPLGEALRSSDPKTIPSSSSVGEQEFGSMSSVLSLSESKRRTTPPPAPPSAPPTAPRSVAIQSNPSPSVLPRQFISAAATTTAATSVSRSSGHQKVENVSVLAASFAAHPELLLRLIWSVLPKAATAKGTRIPVLVAQLPEGARTALTGNGGPLAFISNHRDVFRIFGIGDEMQIFRRSDTPPRGAGHEDTGPRRNSPPQRPHSRYPPRRIR